MNIAAVILCLVAAANVFLGSVVLARNRQTSVNRTFFVLCLCVAGWAAGIAGYLYSGTPGHLLLFFVNWYYLMAMGISLTLYNFACSWSGESSPRKHVFMLAVGIIWILATVAYPHSVVTTVVDSANARSVHFNVLGQTIYSITFLSLFVLAVWKILRRQRHLNTRTARASGPMAVGISIAGLFGTYFNLVLPWFGIYNLIWAGPSFSLIFVSAVAYAIIRRRLFDIRPVLVRTIGYMFTIIIAAAIIGLAIFTPLLFISHVNISWTLRIVLALAAGIATILFQNLKISIDSFTERLFYRDTYNPGALFDAYNKALVSTIDPEQLVMRTADIINGALKAQFCYVAVRSDTGKSYRLIGARERELGRKDLTIIEELAAQSKQAALVTDFLIDERTAAKQVLVDNNIQVLARLSTGRDRATAENLGLLMLGPKRSGSQYSWQDVQVIESLANELSIALQNALRFEQIERFNETLQEKVDVATRRLRSSNDKLKALDETKDDFISMASHQLRTPLTSAKGYLSMVLDGDAGDLTPTQRHMLSQAYNSAQHMVYLIADLLNVSRLKTGKFVIDARPVDLSAVIEEELQQLAEVSASRSLKLHYDKPANFPVLNLDETKIRQVVMNFVDNALYYTPAGGEITVQLTDKPSSIELKVTDNGIGVPRAEQHHLFTKFYRAGNARKVRPDGTGLGLFMARKVVLEHGGAILFSSHEGKGSTFGFTLNKARLAALLPADQQIA